MSCGISQSTGGPAYAPFKPSDSALRSGPSYYRGCWHEVSRPFLWEWSFCSYSLTAVYTPRGFILHAALLRHAFAHCGIFVTAASRRSPGSVSVPMRRVMLSHPLPVVGLVGHYPTNNLIGRFPIPRQQAFARSDLIRNGIMRYYSRFLGAIPHLGARQKRIPRPFATLIVHRSGRSRSTCMF